MAETPTFAGFLLRMERLNRIARIGCPAESVLAVSEKLWKEYEAKGTLALLMW